MATNFCIDGFNFYYGAVRGTEFKWLDFRALFEQVLPNNEIGRIRYSTARLEPRPGDPQQPQRQQTYLRALATIPDLTIHYGRFLTSPVRLPLSQYPHTTMEVLRTEEKGSHVNLATYLLLDAFDSDYDTAIVVSNDSDLIYPIEVVRRRFQKKVGILNPQNRKISWALKNASDFYRPVRPGVLATSQFPPTLRDPSGTISKPSSW